MGLSKERVKVIFILVAILLLALLLLSFAVNIKNESTEESMIKNAMKGTNWPVEEVPILYKENMKITEDQYFSTIEIPSGVSYDELREYLIRVYDSGFKPNEDFGVQNPNNMTLTTENMDLKQVLWIGSKDKYQINVTWAEEGAKNVFGDPYEINFEVVLYTEPDMSKINENSSNQELDNVIESENLEETIYDTEISGETEDVVSEEVIETSGETNEETSGETEDVINEEVIETSGETIQ